jgi:hypothetical protein
MNGTRRTVATALVTAVGLLLTIAQAAAGSPIPPAGSPDTVERHYQACTASAPRTPDSHERWVESCRAELQA